MLQVDLVGIQVDPQTGAAVLVLREHDAPNRLLPIVVGGAEAASIALAAQGQVTPRPMTHDLMATLVERFDGHLDAVEVVDFQEGAFIANLAVSGPTGDLRVDTRPSDAIALAVRLHAPLFVSEHVLDEAGAYPEPEGDSALDDAQIDAQVDQFRSFLDELAPEDFAPDATDSNDATDAPDSNDAQDALDAQIIDAEIVDEPPDPDVEQGA